MLTPEVIVWQAQKAFDSHDIDETISKIMQLSYFVDKKVEFKGTNPLYDYRVHRIAQSLNQVVIAIKKVDK